MIKIEYENHVLEELCLHLLQIGHVKGKKLNKFVLSKIRAVRRFGLAREKITINFTYSRTFPEYYRGPDNEEYQSVSIKIGFKASVFSDSKIVTIDPFQIYQEYWKNPDNLKTHDLIQKLVNIKTVMQKLSK